MMSPPALMSRTSYSSYSQTPPTDCHVTVSRATPSFSQSTGMTSNHVSWLMYTRTHIKYTCTCMCVNCTCTPVCVELVWWTGPTSVLSGILKGYWPLSYHYWVFFDVGLGWSQWLWCEHWLHPTKICIPNIHVHVPSIRTVLHPQVPLPTSL